MSEIITLCSSDDEYVQPTPKKKIKPLLVIGEVSIITKTVKKSVSDVVVLSDDESEGNSSNISIDLEDAPKEEYSEVSTNKENGNSSITIPDDPNEILTNDSTTENAIELDQKSEGDENKDSDNIIIDESSSASSSGKENKTENNLPNEDTLNGPSTSTAPPVRDKLLEDFLQVCEKSISDSQYAHLKDKQFPMLSKYYKKCCAKLSESSDFLQLVRENMSRAENSPATAVISFNEIFQYVKAVVDAESVEVSEEHRIKLKKLEKTIRLLMIKIKQLENTEINFDDEEDSCYMQLDRYTNRLNKVHKKYCELLKKNPYSGRRTYEKLDFVYSEYNELNRAISKKYKNNEKFPSYYEMEQYVRKIISENNLDLSEKKIKSESEQCFKKLGEILQSRRRKELYDAHYLYIRDSEDPADADKSLDSTLKQNFIEGQVKIEKVCDEFRVKQELGGDAEPSEEGSDKSNDENSEIEEITDH